MSAEPCGYCGAYHGVRCPSVQAIEYYPDGTVKRVEFAAADIAGGLADIATVIEDMSAALDRIIERISEQMTREEAPR